MEKLLLACAAILALAPTSHAQTDWPTYGHDLAGTRYSPLRQITPANVTQLQRAWTYHMTVEAAPVVVPPPNAVNDAAIPAGGRGRGGRGGRGGGFGGQRQSQVSPLVIGGVMYLTTAYNRVVALEPETAKELWNQASPTKASST